MHILQQRRFGAAKHVVGIDTDTIACPALRAGRGNFADHGGSGMFQRVFDGFEFGFADGFERQRIAVLNRQQRREQGSSTLLGWCGQQANLIGPGWVGAG